MPKTITATFRINEGAHNALSKEARAQNISQNTLLNHILTRYAEYEKAGIEHRIMRFTSRPVLSILLEGVSEEYLEGQGKKLGSFHPRDFLASLSLPIDSSSFHILLDYLSKYAFWFRLQKFEQDNEIVYHLRNDLGWKWTKFLMGYMEATSKSVFGIPITTESTEFSLTIKVRVKPFD